MSTIRPFFRYSVYDAIPALCGVGIVALILWTFLCFHSLPWWVLVPAFLAVAWSYCWNMQCISHNFIHNPFFSNVWLNRGYSVLETLALGRLDVEEHRAADSAQVRNEIDEFVVVVAVDGADVAEAEFFEDHGRLRLARREAQHGIPPRLRRLIRP